MVSAALLTASGHDFHATTMDVDASGDVWCDGHAFGVLMAAATSNVVILEKLNVDKDLEVVIVGPGGAYGAGSSSSSSSCISRWLVGST